MVVVLDQKNIVCLIFQVFALSLVESKVTLLLRSERLKIVTHREISKAAEVLNFHFEITAG